MRILAIESSCDETAIAILSGVGDVLTVEKSLILSQIAIHAEFGGVVPEVAARKHLEAIMPMLKAEVSPAGEGIDAIAVTKGPGLAPALRTGVEVAKTLAWLWRVPLIPVSHMEGHIYASWLQSEIPILPALVLVVSGGHTELVLMKGHGDFERLGETLDDAAGEAFDKTAKMIGLPYPGGPEIARLAVNGNRQAFDFPRALLTKPGYDFSFSGLKTSVLYTLRNHEERLTDPQFLADIAASIETAIVDALIAKTKKAAMDYAPKTLLLAGGVGANQYLRERLVAMGQEIGVAVILPERRFTTDNAAMIASAGYFRFQQSSNAENPLFLEADPNLDFCKKAEHKN